MKNIFFALLFILLNFSITSCSKDSSTEPDQEQEGAGTLITEKFNIFLHGNVSIAQRDEIADSLNSNYDRIVADLRVTEMPKVRIDIWVSENSSDFYSVMRDRTGQVFAGATGYTPSATEMFMLYNNATPLVAVHEFAHLVSLKLNPSIGNNPRWLWEAVAQYESNSFTHPSTWMKMI